jgi:methyl-accepting chemotaxis protein
MNSMNRLLKGAEIAGLVDKNVLELRRNEKDFLARKNQKYVQKFNDRTDKLFKNVAQLKAIFLSFDLKIEKINQFEGIVKDYQNKFSELNILQEKIGYQLDEGVTAQLRNAGRQLESIASNYDLKIVNEILLLRRAEKDFMLRRDSKYISKVVTQLSKIKELVPQNNLPNNFKSILNEYEMQFLSLSKLYQEFGLTAYEGKLGELRKTIHQTETLLKDIIKLNSAEIESNSQ